jgi:selenide,water dikinase
VDFTTGDDAGVFRLDETTALVQTVDFFTPVVDEPADFGRIAAANALSDVYAMGGRPITALAVAAFPERDFPPEWGAAIVAGGAETLRQAGCALLGGHSVRDPEIKFGYAVTGLVDPARMMTNAGGRAGQVLVLTKPLGTGILATALKAGVLEPGAMAAATASMATLNARAAEAALAAGVRAATDVTGFGLAGHALNLARESGLTLEVLVRDLPVLPGVEGFVESHSPGGLRSPDCNGWTPSRRRCSSTPRPREGCCSSWTSRRWPPCSPPCPARGPWAARGRGANTPSRFSDPGPERTVLL